MNDSKIKNKIFKINEKSLKKFDEIIMDSIIELTIYNKVDKDMLQRLTLAHISFLVKVILKDLKLFQTRKKIYIVKSSLMEYMNYSKKMKIKELLKI